jgi:hypothetical protein
LRRSRASLDPAAALRPSLIESPRTLAPSRQLDRGEVWVYRYGFPQLRRHGSVGFSALYVFDDSLVEVPLGGSGTKIVRIGFAGHEMHGESSAATNPYPRAGSNCSILPVANSGPPPIQTSMQITFPAVAAAFAVRSALPAGRLTFLWKANLGTNSMTGKDLPSVFPFRKCSTGTAPRLNAPAGGATRTRSPLTYSLIFPAER